MLKPVSDLLSCARLCAREPGKVGDAGTSVMSFLVLHLKESVVTVPRELEKHVKTIEKFCGG